MTPGVTAACVLALALSPLVGAAEERAAGERYWPSWRGPDGNGVAPHADPPLRWGESENVRWKVEIPGNGLSSPVVWGDRVFVLTAAPVDAGRYAARRAEAAAAVERGEWPPQVEPVAQELQVLAFARANGKLLWRSVAVRGVPHEGHHVGNSWASGSPVTDGEVLVAHFGSFGTYAYDLDGEPLWQVDLGDMETRNGFGEGTSPALAGDLVVINWDHEGDSFIVALDKTSGEEVWRTARPGEITSWATPLIVSGPEGPQVVLPATGRSRGYDLATGREIWSLAGMTVNTVPSAVHREGVVYLTSGFRGEILQAVDLTAARGEVEGTPALLWEHTRHTPYVPTPLVYGDQIYFFKHLGNVLTTLEAADGEVVYTEQRVEPLLNVWSSPVGAAGRVYAFDQAGTGVVLAHGPAFEVLAVNHLDDRFDSTPALVDGEMYLRGRQTLYCIAAEAPSQAAPGAS